MDAFQLGNRGIPSDARRRIATRVSIIFVLSMIAVVPILPLLDHFLPGLHYLSFMYFVLLAGCVTTISTTISSKIERDMYSSFHDEYVEVLRRIYKEHPQEYERLIALINSGRAKQDELAERDAELLEELSVLYYTWFDEVTKKTPQPGNFKQWELSVPVKS